MFLYCSNSKYYYQDGEIYVEYDYNGNELISSGIDTINLEFDQISSDLSFTYKINNKEYTSKVKSRVYTLGYDYKSDAEITISNAFESKTIKLDKEELSRKISDLKVIVQETVQFLKMFLMLLIQMYL